MTVKQLYLTIALSVCALWLAATATADTAPPLVVEQEEFARLNQQFQRFTADFYPKYARLLTPIIYQTPEQLDAAVEQHLVNKEPLLATAVLHANLPLIKTHINNPKVIDYITLLLDQNEWQSANALFALAQEEGSKTLISNLAYLVARYHFERNDWQRTLELLNGITADLPQERSQHALLLQGIALQQLKKHRDAIKFYDKIQAPSQHYVLARLNMAIANIRQDWWTDAHIIIEDLLKHPLVTRDDAMIDRLHTTLGYSFLQQRFYRNAREVFRNVGQNSVYANQALLGIALAAGHQEDYIGALNAARLLKEKQEPDSTVDEAYLLLPYFYEKLQQPATASAAYDEAVQYFTNHINAINTTMLIDLPGFRKQHHFDGNHRLHLQNQLIDIPKHVPRSFMHSYQQLGHYQSHVDRLGDKQLSLQFSRLMDDYALALYHLTHKALDGRISQLTHYLNQSRYSIARLFDTHEAVNP